MTLYIQAHTSMPVSNTHAVFGTVPMRQSHHFLFATLRPVNVHEFIYDIPIRKDLRELINTRQANGLSESAFREQQQKILERDKEYRVLLKHAKKNPIFYTKAVNQRRLVMNLLDEMFEKKVRLLKTGNQKLVKQSIVIDELEIRPIISSSATPIQTFGTCLTPPSAARQLSNPPIIKKSVSPPQTSPSNTRVAKRIRSVSLSAICPMKTALPDSQSRMRSVSFPLIRSSEKPLLTLFIEPIQRVIEKWYENIQQVELFGLDAPALF